MALRGKCLIFRQSRLARLPPMQRACETLLENGIAFVVLEFGEWEGEAAPPSDGIPKIRFHHSWIKYFPHTVRALLGFLSTWVRVFFKIIILKDRPSLMIGNGLQEDVLAWTLGKLTRIPYAIFVHEIFEPKELSPFNRALYATSRFSLTSASFLTCPDPARLELLKKKYSLNNPFYLLPNCPRLRKKSISESEKLLLREKLNIPHDTLVIVYLGGIGRDNALELVIRSLAGNPKFHFLALGWAETHYRNAINFLVQELKVESQVHFIGPTEKKWPYLEMADIGYAVYRGLYLRSRLAAMASNKLFEYFASGIPAVTRTSSDFELVQQQGAPCLMLETLEAAPLTQLLKDLQRNPTRLEALKAQALQAHKEFFYFERAFEPVLKHVEKFINTPASLEILVPKSKEFIETP